MAVNIASLEAVNTHRWGVMHMKASRIAGFHEAATRLCLPANKARYQGVTDALLHDGHQAVPWWFIAIVSEREYGGPPHWDKQLGQGDPLTLVSYNEPKGMGPYLSHPTDTTPGNDAWTRCALDNLINQNPFPARWTTWTIGGVLTLFEEYNGLGYAMRGVPSAYVWSGTDQYVSGKYVKDGVYDPHTVDVQEGCAPILAMMMTLDTSIKIAA